jgi:predicted nucleic acid-binding Zn ribbon protein
MPLSEQEKNGLRDQLALLLEANEPESILATLQRLAERKAHSVTRGAITELEALRWQSLANACASAAKELELANAPRQAQRSAVEAHIDTAAVTKEWRMYSGQPAGTTAVEAQQTTPNTPQARDEPGAA